ncbi:hypothetical protein BdWA1_002378 [Babesia duncani]|uniref:Uncharacterized protein n=1 Tax=Babesia duncani TaxID=323732 RepID=A0AAD9PJD8_9APIC|nr:hypothetical protein BdWA1_002378 [Babesia duncani]
MTMCNALNVIYALSLLVQVVKSHDIPNGPVGLRLGVTVNDAIPHRRRRIFKEKQNTTETEMLKKLETAASQDEKALETDAKVINELETRLEENGIHAQSSSSPQIDLTVLLPAWLLALPTNYMAARFFVMNCVKTLASMGLASLVTSNVFSNVICNETSSEEEKIICTTQAINNMTSLLNTGIEILSLNYRILSGGRTAYDALATLNTIAADPTNRDLVKMLGSTAVLYLVLMREGTPDETKQLAGSVMTEISSLPVVSNISDVSTGGFGRTNVIIPRPSRMNRSDYDIAKLLAGAEEKQLLSSVS